jgi:hypothetical protein
VSGYDWARRIVLMSHSDRMAKGFGGLSGALFVLGNVMVFHPLPTKQDTCYQSSPLLWWGVMSVLAVGWALIAQVFFVVVVVGIGGQAVMVSPLPFIPTIHPY